MKVVSGIPPCHEAVLEMRRSGGKVGLVPTMGAVHEGHLSLIRAARERCTTVAVSIFVNPTQFGPAEDFEAYPRNLDSDLQQCDAAGVDLVFTPSVETMYAEEALTTVHVEHLADVLCGVSRPGHFDGVATVVAKLFHVLAADAAFFGEKDYQQLMVIRRMAQDLNFPIEIVGCPTVREPDGLALSSRNARLNPQEREQAVVLSQSLFAAADQVSAGDSNTGNIVRGVRRKLRDANLKSIDYVEIVDAKTLDRLTIIDRPARICLAVRVGSCRLIDNVPVDAAPQRA